MVVGAILLVLFRFEFLLFVFVDAVCARADFVLKFLALQFDFLGLELRGIECGGCGAESRIEGLSFERRVFEFDF